MITQEQINEITNNIAERTGYRFQNPDLLIRALTRKSAQGIHVPKSQGDFEELEFLGDRVLNLVIAGSLLELNPKISMSQLAQSYTMFTRNSDASKKNGGPLYRVAKDLDIESLILKSVTEDLAKHGAKGKNISPKKRQKKDVYLIILKL